jgi:hypothetical protein
VRSRKRFPNRYGVRRNGHVVMMMCGSQDRRSNSDCQDQK